jgi:hypothetical protein
MAIFWVVAPCGLVDIYRRFRGACCLYHQSEGRPDYGGSRHFWKVGRGDRLTDYKVQHATFILAPVITSNLAQRPKQATVQTRSSSYEEMDMQNVSKLCCTLLWCDSNRIILHVCSGYEVKLLSFHCMTWLFSSPISLLGGTELVS